MKKRKYVLGILMMGICLSLSGCTKADKVDSAAKEEQTEDVETQEQTEDVETQEEETTEDEQISMEEAIEIGNARLAQDNYQGKLVHITSVDKQDTKLEEGVDGKRKYWGLVYRDVEDKSTGYWIDIELGEVTDFSISTPIQAKSMEEDDVQITSKEAYDIAVAEGLQPGNDWQIGYDYEVYKSSWEGSKEQQPVMSVYGQAQDGNRCYVAINTKTKEMLGVYEKVLNDSGEEEWTKAK